MQRKTMNKVDENFKSLILNGVSSLLTPIFNALYNVLSDENLKHSSGGGREAAPKRVLCRVTLTTEILYRLGKLLCRSGGTTRQDWLAVPPPDLRVRSHPPKTSPNVQPNQSCQVSFTFFGPCNGQLKLIQNFPGPQPDPSP